MQVVLLILLLTCLEFLSIYHKYFKVLKTGSNKMNKNIIIVLGGAILAAVLVAMLVQVTLGGKKGEVVPTGDTVAVLVAAKDLRVGAELKAGDMRWKLWSPSSLYGGVIVRKDDDQKAEEALKGRLERSFSKGEALVESALLRETKANLVAARLKEDERAVSIKISVSSMVAGFITPGSYVDVILTYKHSASVDSSEPSEIQDMVRMNVNKLATETIIENVRVLAVDQSAEKKNKDEKVKTGKTVTLAVKIRDAEKLAISTLMGTITLAMRGIGDDKANENAPVLTDAKLKTLDDEIRSETIRLKEESGFNSDFVKVYNGSHVTIAPVR